MKMEIAFRLLEILSVPPEAALTTEQIRCKFFGASGSGTKNNDMSLSSELRNIQRYMIELTTGTKDGPALVEIVEPDVNQRKSTIQKGAYERKFYHKKSRVSHWLLTEETALNVLLTREILGRAFGSIEQIGTENISEIAAMVVGSSVATKRIRDCLRVIPDGIGRLPAKIKPNVLQETVNAIAQNRQLKFRYRNNAGVTSELTRSPQGLVAKDGAIYLLATDGLSDSPGRPFALHRIIKADVSDKHGQPRPDFDLDRYIQKSHQLSHTLDQNELPIELHLRVAPEALFHFKERPLSTEQLIGTVKQPGDWHTVTATIPYTLLLVPFLLSMGGKIEVMDPPEVRAEVSQRIQEMAVHYLSN